jgi:hypothetical protein
MRKLLFCVLLFWLAIPMKADASGWCSVVNLGIGSVSEKCSFRSFEACQAYAQSFGSSSFCRVSGYPIEDRSLKRRSKHRR